MKNLIAKLNYFKSKTIAFFGIAGTYLLENAQSVQDNLTLFIPQIQPYLPENPFKTLAAFLVVGGLVLRMVTSTPLSSKGKPKEVSSE